MLRGYQLQLVGYAAGLQPLGVVVYGRVHRQPVGRLGLLVVLAVPRVENEQAVVLGQLLAKVVERLHDVVPGRLVVRQHGGLEAVFLPQHLVHHRGVAHRVFQLVDVLVIVDADQQRVRFPLDEFLVERPAVVRQVADGNRQHGGRGQPRSIGRTGNRLEHGDDRLADFLDRLAPPAAGDVDGQDVGRVDCAFDGPGKVILPDDDLLGCLDRPHHPGPLLRGDHGGAETASHPLRLLLEIGAAVAAGDLQEVAVVRRQLDIQVQLRVRLLRQPQQDRVLRSQCPGRGLPLPGRDPGDVEQVEGGALRFRTVPGGIDRFGDHPVRSVGQGEGVGAPFPVLAQAPDHLLLHLLSRRVVHAEAYFVEPLVVRRDQGERHLVAAGTIHLDEPEAGDVFLGGAQGAARRGLHPDFPRGLVTHGSLAVFEGDAVREKLLDTRQVDRHGEGSFPLEPVPFARVEGGVHGCRLFPASGRHTQRRDRRVGNPLHRYGELFVHEQRRMPGQGNRFR